MQQMSPMSWMIMYLYTNLLIILMNMKIYFNTNPTNKHIFKKKMMNKMTWKW